MRALVASEMVKSSRKGSLGSESGVSFPLESYEALPFEETEMK